MCSLASVQFNPLDIIWLFYVSVALPFLKGTIVTTLGRESLLTLQYAKKGQFSIKLLIFLSKLFYNEL